ncbi:MAG: hypothetical protein BGO38_16320 [Cellulomonas sp. 73-145]|uniref:TfoX/Sxy family protein n=1 Tax=Cellulomonas sp. 73-145 TaxID=1895739 RepID=UPI0009265224|nr:TfoX/Sxy family protein [Cellulomonas sp. 73-145]MBN9327155.1 TfoX/Sxy family protein [Cellulomonas sp.]OJV58898.1 MAG: hypothetical protein BGO38_16320 [Cellulomonas sp. 73-145]
MQIPRPTDADKERFRALVEHLPEVEVKPMFGNLGAFVHGNMFAGLLGSDVGLRLQDPASQAELAATEGTGPFGPAERPMGGYLSLPAAWDDDRAEAWVRRAYHEVAALPAKEPKASKPRGPRAPRG